MAVGTSATSNSTPSWCKRSMSSDCVFTIPLRPLPAAIARLTSSANALMRRCCATSGASLRAR